MSDSRSVQNPDFLAEYTRKQTEAAREEAAARADFEARVAGPASQLRPEWDAAWSALCRLLIPVWSAMRREQCSDPLPEPSSLAVALKPIGEALARLNPIREARLEINPQLHDFTLKVRGIPPRPTDRLARVRDDSRFFTPAPRAAAELLLRAVSDSAEDLTDRVRTVLANDVLRVAFGWFPFMRDCIWPRPAPRRPGVIQDCDPREDPIGGGPACDDWRQQIRIEDYRRAEILLTGAVPSLYCDLFPEWYPETPAPATVGELRAHCLSERGFLSCWNWTDSDYDYGPKLLSLWERVVRVAGGRPYPPLGEGRYDLVRAQAAIDRVVQWCDERMSAESADATGAGFGQAKLAPRSSGGEEPPAPSSSGTQQGEGEKPPAGPFVPLTSWNDILAALNEPHGKAVWKNDEQTRDKIRKLNEQHSGPIRLPHGKGTQPSVDKAALLSWWNGLREHFDARKDEEKAEAESARLTVTDSHNYGASGKVVPGISGSEKRTRAKTDENGKEGKR